MDVKGVLGSISYEDGWITITKKPVGQQPREYRIAADTVTGTRFKPATRLFHGYVQFVVPGAETAPERGGLLASGRPHRDDPHSLSIPHKSNDAARKLVAAVEQARS